MNPARSAGIDAVRVLGISAVIFGHVYTGPLTHEFIYPWHVPLFFFLTGYLWTSGRPLGVELQKRGRTLALPYVGWFVVISLLLAADMARAGGVDWNFLIGPAQGGLSARGPYGTFWFVSVLFFTALLYRLLDRLPSAAVWALAGAGILLGYLFGPWLASTPLAVGSALPCLVYMVAGAAARRLQGRIAASSAWVGPALIVVPLVIIAVTQPAEVDIKQGLYGTPVVGILLACSISFGLVLTSRLVPWPRSFGSLVTELAVVGIAVVLFHPYVITYGRAFGLPPLLILTAALVIPWSLASLLHRTPLSPALIGAPRRTHGVHVRAGAS